MSKLKGLILAAGKSTRMRELSKERPKALVETAGRPVIECVLTGMREACIAEITVVTGYFAEQVEEYFGRCRRDDIIVSCVRQEEINGTGSAVNVARDTVGRSPFLLCFADIFTEPDNFVGMAKDFEQRPCDVLVGVKWVEDPYRGAAVHLSEDDSVIEIIEKPQRGTSSTHWDSAGMYAFSPEVFDYTANLKPSARGEYELPDSVTAMIADGLDVRAFKLGPPCFNVDSPEDIETAERWLAGESE
jgi:dTDP-glucose pyrophosphorylase